VSKDSDQQLRAELDRAARTDDLAERTLEVVSVVEVVAAPLGIHPVVVGGMAVYFWTESDAFVTYDIDVVMEVPDALDSKLAELGFVRAADGRHWMLEGTDIFLEAPSSRLDADAVVAEIELPSGRTAKVISRVDILIDRLSEFEATGHEDAAQQALVLLADISRDEALDLEARASSRRLGAVLTAVRKLADDLAAGHALPESGDLHKIAQDALRAEYPSKRP
jgi:hypothetical protein